MSGWLYKHCSPCSLSRKGEEEDHNQRLTKVFQHNHRLIQHADVETLVGAKFLFYRGVTVGISNSMLLSRQKGPCRYFLSSLKNFGHFGILDCTPLDQLLTIGIEKDDAPACLQICIEI